MSFASTNRNGMRNVNPPGYRPPGHVPNPPGEVPSPPVVETVPAPIAVAPIASAPIASDGRVAGIDGMLAQVSEALVKQVSLDHELQIRVGTAAGAALGETLLTGLFVGWVVKTVWNALPER